MTKELFIEITQWQDETFPNSSASSRVHHLEQEVKELIHDLLWRPDMPHVKQEFADCFFLLFGAAKSFGMSYEDIQKCIKEKFEINKSRKWGKPDTNGVVNHI